MLTQAEREARQRFTVFQQGYPTDLDILMEAETEYRDDQGAVLTEAEREARDRFRVFQQGYPSDLDILMEGDTEYRDDQALELNQAELIAQARVQAFQRGYPTDLDILMEGDVSYQDNLDLQLNQAELIAQTRVAAFQQGYPTDLDILIDVNAEAQHGQTEPEFNAEIQRVIDELYALGTAEAQRHAAELEAIELSLGIVAAPEDDRATSRRNTEEAYEAVSDRVESQLDNEARRQRTRPYEVPYGFEIIPSNPGLIGSGLDRYGRGTESRRNAAEAFRVIGGRVEDEFDSRARIKPIYRVPYSFQLAAADRNNRSLTLARQAFRSVSRQVDGLLDRLGNALTEKRIDREVLLRGNVRHNASSIRSDAARARRAIDAAARASFGGTTRVVRRIELKTNYVEVANPRRVIGDISNAGQVNRDYSRRLWQRIEGAIESETERRGQQRVTREVELANDYSGSDFAPNVPFGGRGVPAHGLTGQRRQDGISAEAIGQAVAVALVQAQARDGTAPRGLDQQAAWERARGNAAAGTRSWVVGSPIGA